MNGFKIESRESFFKILALEEDAVLNAINNKDNCYVKHRFTKKNGVRNIYEIKNTNHIYYLQKRLNKELFSNIFFPECVYGFRKYKSYFDFLAPHISNNKDRYYLRLDIADFFDSINIDDISEALGYYINDDITSDEKEFIIQLIIDITTLNDKAIQGAVTSPAISNLVFRSLDIRIEKYCKKLGIKYTRYADDLLFSSNTSYIHNFKFTNAIQAIIKDKYFKLNHSKTLKYKNEISLNGYVVGTDIRLSRKKCSDINKIIFNLNKSSFPGFPSRQAKYISRNKLAGYRSYLIQTSRYIHNDKKKNQINNKIKSIERLILKYCV